MIIIIITVRGIKKFIKNFDLIKFQNIGVYTINK